MTSSHANRSTVHPLADEQVVAPCIAPQGRPVAVPLEGVRLDDDPEAGGRPGRDVRRAEQCARDPAPGAPTSRPGTSSAMARSTDSNGLSDRPSARAATRLSRAEPGPRAAVGHRVMSQATAKPSPQGRVGDGQTPRRTAAVARTSRAVVARVRGEPLDLRRRRRSDPRRTIRCVGPAGPRSMPAVLRQRRSGAAAGTTFTFQPWCECGARPGTRGRSTVRASSVPSWTPGTAYRPRRPVDELAGRERLDRARVATSGGPAVCRVATPPRTGHEVRDLHRPSLAAPSR